MKCHALVFWEALLVSITISSTKMLGEIPLRHKLKSCGFLYLFYPFDSPFSSFLRISPMPDFGGRLGGKVWHKLGLSVLSDMYEIEKGGARMSLVPCS